MNVEREMLDVNGDVTLVEADQVGYKYTLTFNRSRPHTALPFFLTTNLSGNSITTDA